MKALTYTAFLLMTCFICAIHTDAGWWYFTAYAQTSVSYTHLTLPTKRIV